MFLHIAHCLNFYNFRERKEASSWCRISVQKQKLRASGQSGELAALVPAFLIASAIPSTGSDRRSGGGNASNQERRGGDRQLAACILQLERNQLDRYTKFKFFFHELVSG